jgi:methionyl-tRNA formyltransferase
VAEKARDLGIELAQPGSVNSEETRARIASAAPTEVVICAFGGLIKEPLLSAHPMLNVHPSLLPRWRGAAPIERAIDAGDAETGVSIMRPVAEMDAGPVCLARREPILEDDDYGTLAARLERLGGDLLIETLDDHPPCRPQPNDGVTLADRITPQDRRLDPGAPADALARRVRALSPHIGAFVELPGGERLQVLKARAVQTQVTSEDHGGVPGPAGEALRAVDGRLLYRCADGDLELFVVKPAGGRAMAAEAYLRGHRATPTLPS